MINDDSLPSLNPPGFLGESLAGFPTRLVDTSSGLFRGTPEPRFFRMGFRYFPNAKNAPEYRPWPFVGIPSCHSPLSVGRGMLGRDSGGSTYYHKGT
jgi:hypothetical protein